MNTLHEQLMEKGGIYAAWHKNAGCQVYHWAALLVVAFSVGSLALNVGAIQDFKPSVAVSRAATAKWVSGFYAGWTAIAYPPSAIDFSSLTHVMMFSVLPNSDGSLDTTTNSATAGSLGLVAQEVASRAHAAGKKAILVVGSDGYDANFASSTSPANEAKFVQNLVDLVNSWGYDGLHIDWAWPLSESNYPAYITLLKDLRAAKPGMLLTVDVGWPLSNTTFDSATAQFYKQVSGLVDQMNIMTYLMADNWPGWVAWHNSALTGESAADHPSSVVSSVNQYLALGIPAAKLGIGIGFFGQCWNAPTNAPLQALGTSHVVASDDSMGFTNIKNLYYSAGSYHYDNSAQVPYLSFSTATGPHGCTFISYDDETSVAAKAAYVNQAGLGGAIIWQLAEGYNPQAADPSSLLHAVAAGLLGTAASTTTDTTPPSATTNLSASPVSSSQITISWSASSDNVAVTGYKVFRNAAQVGTATSTAYIDTGLAAATAYAYTVSAFDAAGNNSAMSSAASATTLGFSSDTTPPSISIVSPTSGAKVARKSAVTITATGQDNVAVAKVEFYVNGSLKSTDAAPPNSSPYYSYSWRVPNSRGVTYTLTAKAYDAAGNVGVSAPVQVTSN